MFRFCIVIISWALAITVAFLQLPKGDFVVHFLDVGQGDAVLIVTPENHHILIDGGRDGAVLNELSEVMPFFDKSLDMVVLSHPDGDHVNGLVEVMKRYEVDVVLLTGVMGGGGSYLEFLSSMEGSEVKFARADEDFWFGEVFVDVLFPVRSMEGNFVENINDSSIAMMVEFGDVKILLTGDLEVEGEAALISTGADLKADVFKAGHHGSKTSSSEELLRRVQPDVVVVQSGADNSYGHPAPEVLRRFWRMGVKEIWRNDEDGRVTLRWGLGE